MHHDHPPPTLKVSQDFRDLSNTTTPPTPPQGPLRFEDGAKVRKELCDAVRRCAFDSGPQWTTAPVSSPETRIQFGQLVLHPGQPDLCSVVRADARVEAPKDFVFTRLLADPRTLPALDVFVREVELVMHFCPTTALYDYKASTPTGCRDIYAYCTRDTDMFSGELLSVWRTVRVDPAWALAAAELRHRACACGAGGVPGGSGGATTSTTDASPLCEQLFRRHHTRPPLSLREIAPWARWCRAGPTSLERRNCEAIEVAAAGMLVHDAPSAAGRGAACVVHVVLAFSAISREDLELFTSGVHGVRMMENIRRCVTQARGAGELRVREALANSSRLSRDSSDGDGAVLEDNEELEGWELETVLAEEAERLNEDLYALLMTPLYEDVWVPLCRPPHQLVTFRADRTAHGGVMLALRGHARGSGATDVEAWLAWAQRWAARHAFLVEHHARLRTLPRGTAVEHVVFAPEFACGQRSECVLLCRCRTGERGTVAKLCFRSFEVFRRVRDLRRVQQSVYPSGMIFQQDGASVKMHFAVVVGMNTGTLGPRITATQFFHEAGVWLMAVGALLHAFTRRRSRIDVAAAAAQVRTALAALLPHDIPEPPNPRCLALMRSILNSAFDDPETDSNSGNDDDDDDDDDECSGDDGCCSSNNSEDDHSFHTAAEDPLVFVRSGSHTLTLHKAGGHDMDDAAVNESALRRLLPRHKRQRSTNNGPLREDSPSVSTKEEEEEEAVKRHSLDDLSDEVVARILKHCSTGTLLRVAQTCRRLHKLVDSPALWKRVYERTCPAGEVLVSTARQSGSAPDYRAACAESQRIWHNWGRGRCATESVPAAHTGRVSSLTLLEERGELLTGGTDRTVRLWARTTSSDSSNSGSVWTCVNTFAGGKAGVAAATKMYDAVVAGYRNGEVRLWSLQDWSLRAKHHLVRQAEGFVLDAGAVVAWDDAIRVFDPKTMAATAVLAGHTRRIVGVVPHGAQALFSCAADRTLRLWDRRSGRCELAADVLGASPTALAVSPDVCISTGTADGSVQAWDLRALAHGPTNVARLHESPVHVLKYGFGMLLSTAEDSTVAVSEPHAVHHLHSFDVPDRVSLADFSNRRIVVSTVHDVLTTLSFDLL